MMRQLRNSILLLFLFPQVLWAQAWEPVPDIDLAKYKVADFADDELDIPFHLKHFHTVANSVVATGPHKGFINIAVWRKAKDNKPYNARIMESIIGLAYFYNMNKPWNIYYRSKAVQQRLEAAFTYWCHQQHTDGRFSEYGAGKWNLAATGFATKFISGALVLLKDAPGLDAALMQRVKETDRKTIMTMLNMQELYDYGRNYTNQYTNVWAGALAYLSLYSDKEMAERLEERIKNTATEFQSPAGFFYEAGGTDFGYNFGTHHSNLWLAYHYSRGTALETYFTEEETRYCHWLAYNALREPAGNTYLLNRAIELRQQTPVVNGYITEAPLGERVPAIRAYNLSTEERKKQLARKRAALEKNWPRVPKLEVGEMFAYDPYFFLLKDAYRWNPTPQQKQAAIQQLPYLAKETFIHQKADSRNPTVFTYVRQPAYYAAFNSGPILGRQQRYGIGILWNPVYGAFLQSQTNSDTAAWGTQTADSLYEAGSILASFRIDDNTVVPVAGDKEWDNGALQVSYSLGSEGTKTVRFNKEQVQVNVVLANSFRECIPLLVGKQQTVELNQAEGWVRLSGNGTVITLTFDRFANASLEETTQQPGGKKLVLLYLGAKGKLSYSFAFHS